MNTSSPVTSQPKTTMDIALQPDETGQSMEFNPVFREVREVNQSITNSEH